MMNTRRTCSRSGPSMGSWLTYGLGTENQNLPGFVVLCPGKPVVGPQLWSNSFLPGVYQGTHINNKPIDPEPIIRAHPQPPPRPRRPARAARPAAAAQRDCTCEQRGGDDQLEARIESLEMAFRMQTEAQRGVRRRPRAAGDPRRCTARAHFADACLIARRLVERGVRIVQVYYGDGQPWDDHGDIEQDHRDKAQDSRPGRSPGCSPT